MRALVVTELHKLSHHTSGPRKNWLKVKTDAWREAISDRGQMFEHRNTGRRKNAAIPET